MQAAETKAAAAHSRATAACRALHTFEASVVVLVGKILSHSAHATHLCVLLRPSHNPHLIYLLLQLGPHGAFPFHFLAPGSPKRGRFRGGDFLASSKYSVFYYYFISTVPLSSDAILRQVFCLPPDNVRRLPIAEHDEETTARCVKNDISSRMADAKPPQPTPPLRIIRQTAT